MKVQKIRAQAIFLFASTICISAFLISANRKPSNASKPYTVFDCCEKGPNNQADTVRTGCVFKTVFENEYNDSDFLMATPENAKIAIKKALKWIVSEQLPDGSWYGGFHATQNILKDPQAQGDPATTSMVSMALLRCGSDPDSGQYKSQLIKATHFLLMAVEQSAEGDLNITRITGTQPQIKLGQNIDAMLTSQYFSNILPYYSNDSSMQRRIKRGIEKCVAKIQRTQNQNGSFKGAGWAGVLQSSIANNALESAAGSGVKVDSAVLEKSRNYQQGNYNISNGAVSTADGAGVVLYTISSTGRASAKQASYARAVIKKAKKEGKISSEVVNASNLIQAGMSSTKAIEYETAYQINTSSNTMAQKNEVMAGFGNNGGEEFYSFLQTGEGLIISRDNTWKQWYYNVTGKLIDIQNSEGSWQGHHCITSPVFCTATCLLILSINQDLGTLADMSGVNMNR